MQQNVLLTGASGYIAKHIALQLLEAGHHVRATVRDLTRAEEVTQAVRTHLSDARNLNDRLTFVALNLLEDTGWDDAMAGIDVVMHTASPFPLAQPNDESELIRPAVDGALRALRSAHRAGVRRMILTSSTAAISGAPLKPGQSAYSEDNWTDPTDRSVTAYSRSKTLAERAAWDFVRDEAPEMELTVVNPGFVVGAPLDKHFGSSIAVIERILRASDPMVPNFGFTAVHVEDVAAMHVAVINKPETIGQRIMTVDQFIWFVDIAKTVKAALPERKIVTRVAPNFVMRVLGIFDPAIRSILPSLGKNEGVDNSRARATLGRDMRDARDGVADAARYLVAQKIVA